MGIIKRRHLIHIPFIVAALVVAGIYYFRTANPDDSRPFGPGMFQGPPPMMQEGSMPPLQPMDGMAPPRQDMRPPMDGNRPPMDGMRPDQMPKDGPRPMRPETMKLLITLLVIGVLWGIMYFIRNLNIVNMNRISGNNRTQVFIGNDTIIPIGESYRQAFIDRIK